MVRTTLGAEVETSVTVSGSESVDYINADKSTTLPSGDSESIIIRPPTGFVYEVLTLTFIVPGVSSATSGTQRIDFESEEERISTLTAKASQSNDLTYDSRALTGGSSIEAPPNTTAQIIAPRGLRGDETRGFRFFTQNNTNADNTNERRYRLWVRQVQVSE